MRRLVLVTLLAASCYPGIYVWGDGAADGGSGAVRSDAGARPPSDAGAALPSDAAAGDLNAQAHQLCLDETNRYRATVGVPPLARSAELEQYADVGAEQDGESGDPHGHFIATNGGGIAFAENEVPQWDGDVLEVVRDGLAAMWSEGPGGGHYENMRSDATLLGCGIYVSASHGVTVVQDFGGGSGF